MTGCLAAGRESPTGYHRSNVRALTIREPDVPLLSFTDTTKSLYRGHEQDFICTALIEKTQANRRGRFWSRDIANKRRGLEGCSVLTRRRYEVQVDLGMKLVSNAVSANEVSTSDCVSKNQDTSAPD